MTLMEICPIRKWLNLLKFQNSSCFDFLKFRYMHVHTYIFTHFDPALTELALSVLLWSEFWPTSETAGSAHSLVSLESTPVTGAHVTHTHTHTQANIQTIFTPSWNKDMYYKLECTNINVNGLQCLHLCRAAVVSVNRSGMNGHESDRSCALGNIDLTTLTWPTQTDNCHYPPLTLDT